MLVVVGLVVILMKVLMRALEAPAAVVTERLALLALLERLTQAAAVAAEDSLAQLFSLAALAAPAS